MGHPVQPLPRPFPSITKRQNELHSEVWKQFSQSPASAILISKSTTVDPSHVNCLLHAVSHLNGVFSCPVGAPVD